MCFMCNKSLLYTLFFLIDPQLSKSSIFPSQVIISLPFEMQMQADIDNSGTLDYGEFIAATMHLNKIEREENMFASFSYFDKDGSGYITQDELQQACVEFGITDFSIEEIMGEVDQDHVSYIIFSAIFFSTTILSVVRPKLML